RRGLYRGHDARGADRQRRPGAGRQVDGRTPGRRSGRWLPRRRSARRPGPPVRRAAQHSQGRSFLKQGLTSSEGSWARLVRFLGQDIWREERGEGIIRAALESSLRVATIVLRSSLRHRLTVRAAAMTYITLFSLVPTLAVAFSIFKALGGLTRATDVLMPK